MTNYEYSSNDEQPNLLPSETSSDLNQNYTDTSSQHYLSSTPTEAEDLLGLDLTLDTNQEQSEY